MSVCSFVQEYDHFRPDWFEMADRWLRSGAEYISIDCLSMGAVVDIVLITRLVPHSGALLFMPFFQELATGSLQERVQSSRSLDEIQIAWQRMKKYWTLPADDGYMSQAITSQRISALVIALIAC